MANLFLQIWLFLKSLPIKMRHLSFKFIASTIAIVLLSWFYIQSQLIHTENISIDIDRIGQIEDNSYITIVNGIDGSINQPSEIGRCSNCLFITDYPNSDCQAESLIDSATNSNTNKGYNLAFHSAYIDSNELTDIKNGLLSCGNDPTLVDSIDILYKVDIRKIMPSFLHATNVNRHIEHIENVNSCNYVEDMPSPSYGTKFFGDTVTCHYIIGTIHDRSIGPLKTGMDSRIFSYFSPIDLSQLYVNFRFSAAYNHYKTLNKNDVSTLIFDFVGNSVFSEMDPQPDKVNMHQIIFSDSTKIAQIQLTGLTFHVDLTDNRNIQTARMFLITTLLSILLAYWISLISRRPNKLGSKRKRRKTEAPISKSQSINTEEYDHTNDSLQPHDPINHDDKQ